MHADVQKAPAGLGKTRLCAKEVAGNVGLFVTEVYVPTIKLAEEWGNHIRSVNPYANVQIIRGRGHEVRSGVHMCARHSMAEALTNAGIAVYPNLCSKWDSASSQSDTCPHYNGCPYLKQFDRADVYIFTHSHLRLDRGRLEQWHPREVIIDESFVMGMYEQVKIPISLLTGPQIPARAQALCRDVAAGLASGGSIVQRLRAATGPRGELNAAINDLSAAPTLSPALPAGHQRQVLSQHVNLKSVQMLLQQLAAEAAIRTTLQSAEFDANKNEIVLHYRHPITRFGQSGVAPRIKILDASADKRLLEVFFQIQNFQQIDVGRKAYVIQCSSTRCSTTSLVPSKNKDKASRKAAQQRLKDIVRLITRLVSDGHKVLVGGPSAVTGNPSKGVAPLLKLPARVMKQVVLAHFGAVRGIDTWKDCTAAVLLGRNQPPIEAVEGIARALFHDDPTPLTLTGTESTEIRGYRMANGAAGVETIVHADDRVQAVHEQIREYESVQAIDRLRLIHSTQIKLVYVLSNIPLDLDVDELRTWSDLIDGTRLEQAWDRAKGVLPLQPDWLAAQHPDLWPTAGAAKKDVQREGSNRGQSPKKISIRNLSPFGFEFKAPSSRRWSQCLAATNDAARVQIELQRLMGVTVQVRPQAPPADPATGTAIISPSPSA